MKQLLIIVAGLLMLGCNGITTAKQMNATSINNPAIPDHLAVGNNLLNRDSVEIEFPVVTQEQQKELTRLTAQNVPDDTRHIGERAIDNDCILAAYLIPTGENPNQFKIYLTTRRNDGTVIDTLDLHEFHTSEYQGRPRLGGNRFYTTDATVTFDGNRHIVQHRVMTLSGLYLKDHSVTEMWRVEWDNDYEIDTTGHFQFKGQKETTRDGSIIDDKVVEVFKSRDLPGKD